MEKENTQVEEEVVVEEAVETESETQDQVQDSKEEEVVEDESIDYQAEYEKVSKKLGKAEYKLDSQRKKLKEAKKEATESTSVDVDQIREEILAESKQEIEKFKQDMSKDTYENVLYSMTNDDDERKLINFYYENRINKTGFSRQDITQDLEDARVLANKKRFEKTMGEMKKSMISKNTKTSQSSPASDGEDSEGVEITLSAEEKKLAAAYGLTPEELRNGIKRN